MGHGHFGLFLAPLFFYVLNLLFHDANGFVERYRIGNVFAQKRASAPCATDYGPPKSDAQAVQRLAGKLHKGTQTANMDWRCFMLAGVLVCTPLRRALPAPMTLFRSSVADSGAIERGRVGCRPWVGEMEGRSSVGESLENGPTRQRSRDVGGRNHRIIVCPEEFKTSNLEGTPCSKRDWIRTNGVVAVAVVLSENLVSVARYTSVV